MGGEWHFTFIKDKDAPFDLKKYQTELLKIRKGFKHMFNMKRVTVTWSKFNQPEDEEDNIFARFSYRCIRQHCQHDEINPKTGSWILYWDPTIESKQSDLYARCSPYFFTDASVEIQKTLAAEFPKHFQLYLGDGIGGCDEQCDQYWGVAPDTHTVVDEYGAWARDYSK